jgi:predicted flap endonuclease-1-like 5' DNA nuclease
MNWLSLLIGALVGWLIEWLIDVFYWRRRRARTETTDQQAQTRLTSAQAEAEQLRAEVGRREGIDAQLAKCEAECARQSAEAQRLTAELSSMRAEVSRREGIDAQLAKCEAECARQSAEAQQLTAELAAMRSESESRRKLAEVSPADTRAGAMALPLAEPALAVDAHVGEPLTEDDLAEIEGIGPKIAQVLKGAGLVTFAQLADSSVEQLRTILAQAGPRFALANPETWPQQARLAAAGSWEELKKLQEGLRGGVKRS